MTNDQPIRYAAVAEHDIHPDYQPDGIAPRLGHYLNQLAAEDGTHAALAEGILRVGDHSILPILADALDDVDHPTKDQFDLRHAPRAMKIDRALQQVIDNHKETVDIHPTVVAHNWRSGSRFRISRRKSKDIIKKTVPDVNNNDLAHSVLRLSLNAGIADGVLSPDVPPEWFSTLHNQYAKELGSNVPNPHSYTDTRPANKRLYRLKELLAKYGAYRSPVGGMVVKESGLGVVGQYVPGGKFVRDLTKLDDAPTPTSTPTPKPKLTLTELKKRIRLRRTV